jgi:hypothetical protein
MYLSWAQGVAGSNPVAPTTFRGSIPVTWATVHSGDIGNTFVRPVRACRSRRRNTFAPLKQIRPQLVTVMALSWNG